MKTAIKPAKAWLSIVVLLAAATGAVLWFRNQKEQATATAVISGVVVTAQGAPVQAYDLVVLRALKEGESATTRFRRALAREQETVAVSGARGAFRIERLSAGTYDVVAHLAGGRFAKALGIDVAPNAVTKGIRLVAEDGFEVVGQVAEHESGRPLVGVPVSVPIPGRRLQTVTDRAGNFTLSGVPRIPAVHVRISAEPPTHVLEAVYVTPPRDGRVDLGAVRLITADPRNPMKGKMGVSYTEENGKIVVMTMMAGCPGERAGLRVGDVVLAVDGRTTTGNLADMISRIRVEPGRLFTFLVQSPNERPREIRFGRAM